MLRPLPEEPGGQKDGVDDFFIPGAAADIIADGNGRLVPGGIRVPINEALGAQHHPRDAEAALHRARRAEGVSVDLLLPRAEALHGDDGPSLELGYLLHARFHRLPIRQDGTGAAGALTAPVLYRSQPHAPQQLHQRAVLLRLYLRAVDREGKHGHVSFSLILWL